MRTWIAIVFAVGLIAACMVISPFISPLIGFPITWIMVLGTSLWAAIDSSRIALRRYKSGISCHPVILFFGCALIWIIAFPWYLVVRYKIKSGTAVLDLSREPASEAVK